MIFGYPIETLRILLFMILSGAGRTLGVRVYYQMGFEDPLLSSVLFILAHALSILLYFYADFVESRLRQPEDDDVEEHEHAHDGMHKCDESIVASHHGNRPSHNTGQSSARRLYAGSRKPLRTSSIFVSAKVISDILTDYQQRIDSSDTTFPDVRPARASLSSTASSSSRGHRRNSSITSLRGGAVLPTGEIVPAIDGRRRFSLFKNQDGVDRNSSGHSRSFSVPSRISKSAPVSSSATRGSGHANKCDQVHLQQPKGQHGPAPTATSVAPQSQVSDDLLDFVRNNFRAPKEVHEGNPDETMKTVNSPIVRNDIDATAINSDNNGTEATVPKRTNQRGSLHGLTEESKRAAAWAHSVPWWFQPFFPSILNVLDTVCRWSSLLFLPASVAEMMIAGLELVLSVFAARYMRKRLIAKERWVGVAIVSVGLVIVGASGLVNSALSDSTDDSNTNNDDNDDGLSSDNGSYGIGLAFVLGKVVMGVLKDLSEEVFMQETEMPAMLLLGMEGCYGLLVAVPLYFIVGPSLGYDAIDSFQKVVGSPINLIYTICLVLVFLAAGSYQILSTAVTSSMTRNLWKNFRGLVVWTVGMVLFYVTSSMASNNSTLGEPWIQPGSFLVLAGYVMMMIGLKVYYGTSAGAPAAAGNEDEDEGKNDMDGNNDVGKDDDMLKNDLEIGMQNGQDGDITGDGESDGSDCANT